MFKNLAALFSLRKRANKLREEIEQLERKKSTLLRTTRCKEHKTIIITKYKYTGNGTSGPVQYLVCDYCGFSC